MPCAHPRFVVLLGDFGVGVSKQDGDFFKRGTADEHFDGEGIAQRVGVSARDASGAKDGLESPPPRFSR